MKRRASICVETSEQDVATQEFGHLAGGINITFRSVLVSLIALSVLVIAVGSAQINETTSIDVSFVPSPAGIVPVLTLLLFNVLLGRIAKRLAFRQSELVAIYSMVSVGAVNLLVLASRLPGVVTGLGVMRLKMTSELVDPFLETTPSWVIVKDEDAIMTWLLGVERAGKSIPWHVWILPIITWVVFYSLVFWMFICLVTVARKRWVEHEQLIFPLTVPVLDLIQNNQYDSITTFWKNKTMWCGLIGSFLLTLLPTLHSFIGWIPNPSLSIPLGIYFTGVAEVVGRFPILQFTFHPFIVGVGYLLPLDSLLTIWVSVLAGMLGRVMLNAFGLYETASEYELYHRFIGVGAYFGVAISTLWLMRYQIKEMLTLMFRTRHNSEFEEDSNEPLSYNAALWGLVLGFLVLLIFSKVVLHGSLWYQALLFIEVFAVGFAFARIRGSIGVPDTGLPTGMDWMGVPLRVLGREGAVARSYFHHWTLGGFSGNIALAMESYKLGDEVGLKRRSMTKALFIAFTFSLLVGFLYNVRATYIKGWAFLVYLPKVTQSWSFAWAFGSVIPGEGRFLVWGLAAVGTTILAVLMWLRTTFIWWPIDPVAFAVAFGLEPIIAVVGSFFLAWVIKSSVLRYGGPVTQKKLTPLFVGIMLGYVLSITLQTALGFPV